VLGPDEPRPRSSRATAAVLASTSVTTLWLVARPHIGASAGTALLVAAIAAFLVARRARPGPRAVVACTAIAMTVAVVLQPFGSRDVWSYIAYGHIVVDHRANPYLVAPAAFPEDPTTARVAPGWRSTPTVYGPAFTGASATIAAISRGSLTAERRLHQAMAAACSVMIAGVLWQRRRSLDGFMLLGLNPAALAIVNGGHNDLLVGALVSAGAWATARRHAVAGGALIGLAASVKVIALITLLVVLLQPRQGRARTAGAALGVTALGYLLVGGPSAVAPLLDAGGMTSRAAVWSGPRAVAAAAWGEERAGTIVAVAAAVAIVAFGSAAARRRARQDGATAMATTLGGTTALLPYTLPWYSGWGLAVAGSSTDATTRSWVLAESLVLLAAYAVPPGTAPPPLIGTVGALLLPLLITAGVAAWVLAARRSKTELRGLS